MELELLNPDTVWEPFTCDSCYRYLSVSPIRVYPNKRIICGRCSKNDDDEMVTPFCINADQFIFKCVNRFDGCRKLLSSNLVEKHEENCLSKRYFCPLCPTKSPELPTYLLLPHFKEEHKSNILEKPWIFVNSKDSSLVNKILLYKTDDYLFFVRFIMSDSSYFLSALHVGSAEKARKIIQNFSLYTKDNKLEFKTKSKSCDYFGSSNPEGFLVKKPEFQSEEFIILIELDLKGVELSGMLPSDMSKMFDSSNFGKLQKIFLSPVCLNSYPKYSVDTTGIALVITENGFERKVIFQCCICFVKLTRGKISTLDKGGKSFCRYCVGYYQAKEPNVEMEEFNVPQELQTYLTFFCRWNCNELIVNSGILRHNEECCSLQPLKVCPVECCDFEGNSYHLRKHFETEHPPAKLYLDSTTCKINLLNRNTSKQKSYFLIDNTFLLLEEENDHDKRIFSIKYCREEDANAKLQPAVIVYATKYIGTFRNNIVYYVSQGYSSFVLNIILETVRH